jgi:predicted peptidase
MAVMAGLSLSLQEPQSQPVEATPAPATGFLYKTVEFENETYAYCVYVPPEYTPQKAWPAILFLHGSGQRGRDGIKQTDVGIGQAIRRHREWIPGLVVMPQCRPAAGWMGGMAELALRCVEQTSREYHLDPERVYLVGLSLGGAGVWHIGARLPGRFAALVPICGFGNEEDASRLVGVPIWCFHGSADKRVPVERSREMVAAIQEAGGNVTYTEYEGGSHNVWDRTFANPKLWQWLFAQRRERARDAAP